MPYTPVELRHVRIGRALLGYKRQAVQNLLAEIADSFETVWRERHELADRVERLDRELMELRTREQALSQTLVVAEQAAAKVKEHAKREADLILAEARSEARALNRNAQAERQRLHAEARRIEALLRGALGMIEESAVEYPPDPVEEPSDWPEDEETGEPQGHGAEVEEAPVPADQPELAKVSGLPLFEWVEER
jgi:cell division septum initiation protein DivIVA